MTIRQNNPSDRLSPVGPFRPVQRWRRRLPGHYRDGIGVGNRQSNELGFGREAEDQTGLTQAAIGIGTGGIFRMRFLVLVIVMTDMFGHRILLMLTIGTDRRCS